MTLGEKLKEVRKRFGLSQEDLGSIMNVSRQAITKWENDIGIPDTENLKELSKIFGITIDYLLDNNKNLPLLIMRIELDKEKYKNKLSSYDLILKKFFSDYKIYALRREKKMNVVEKVLDFFVDIMPITVADITSNVSPYYLVKKDNIKLLINIKDYILEAKELNSDINDKKFVVDKNIFRRLNEVKIKVN